jgi:hypothetical protein
MRRAASSDAPTIFSAWVAVTREPHNQNRAAGRVLSRTELPARQTLFRRYDASNTAIRPAAG